MSCESPAPPGACAVPDILSCPSMEACVQVTVSLIVKDYLQNVGAMRALFFSRRTDEASLSHYQQLLNKYSTPMLVLDLKMLRVRLLGAAH